jgi:hypothetical protein
MIDNRGLKLVVIGCTPGSGSRVLQHVLTSSSEIYMDRNISPASRDSFDTATYTAHLGQDAAVIEQAIDRFKDTILAQIPAGEESKYRYFGWKLPENLLVIDQLFAVAPDMRFLHLLRDPAAMTRSSHERLKYAGLRRNNRIPEELGRKTWILTRWAEQNLPVWEAYRDHPQYRVVRYEDLVWKPKESIPPLFEWLDVSFDLDEALAGIDPPFDALRRGDGVNVRVIADACERLGYGYRVPPK